MNGMISKRIDLLTSDQRGFNLIELLVTLGIIGILAGLVAGATGSRGGDARLGVYAADAVNIETSAEAFKSGGVPETYPVSRPTELVVTGIDGVGVLNFDAPLNTDLGKTFVPDFLKQVPNSAAQVSWRVDTDLGLVFPVKQGSKLVKPSDTRLTVKATTSTTSAVASAYDFTFRMKAKEAGVETFTIQIPEGYSFNGNPSQTPGTVVGTLAGNFETDNPWQSGQTLTFTGSLVTTGPANQWKLVIAYPTEVTTAAAGIKRDSPDHLVKIIPPTSDSPGLIEITFDRDGEPTGVQHNQATENWTLTIGNGGTTIITNPDLSQLVPAATAAVYRWLAEEHSTVDIDDVFDRVAGNQAIVIGAGS